MGDCIQPASQQIHKITWRPNREINRQLQNKLENIKNINCFRGGEQLTMIGRLAGGQDARETWAGISAFVSAADHTSNFAVCQGSDQQVQQ